MGGLSLLAWRSVSSRRVRSLLTIAGIALGVGVLFAAMATNAGIDSSIDTTVHQMMGRADLRVSAFGETGLGPDSLTAIAATPGVGVVAPQLEERTYLQLAPGASRSGFNDAVTILGIDPVADPRLHDLPIASGQPLGSGPADSVLITERLSSATGLGVGAQLPLLGSAKAGPLVFEVAGIVSGAGPFVATDGRTVIMPIAAAQQLFATDRVTRADVGLAAGSSADAVVAGLDQRLTFEPFVVSSPADLASSLRSSAVDFRSLTALIAAISLFVGAFLIFNTLSMTVVERVRDVGLLRAAGTTARQVNVFILQQALALGIAGSLLGLALGVVLAAAVVRYVQAVDAIPLDGLDVPVGGVVLALLVGIAVTLAAALEPAYRAGRIPPVEALKARVDPTAGLRARLRWLVVVFVVVAVAGLLLWPAGAGLDQLARSLLVFGILLAGTLATPFLLGPLGRLAGLPFAAILPAEERLTRGALVRDRSRTVLTVGALTIGLAMIVAVGGLAQNAHRSASDWLSDVVPGDEVVTAIRPAPLDEGLQDELAAVDGVSRVTPVATFAVAYQGVRLDAAAVTGADFLADGRLTFATGDRRAALDGLDAGGSVVLPTAMADRLGLRVGRPDGAPRRGRQARRPARVRNRGSWPPGFRRRDAVRRLVRRDQPPRGRRSGLLRRPFRARTGRCTAGARERRAAARARAELDRPGRGRDQQRARQRVRAVRRAGDRSRPHGGSRDRQHAVDERARAGSRDRGAPGDRHDPPAGRAHGARGGGNPRPRRALSSAP